MDLIIEGINNPILDFMNCFVKWEYKQRCKVLPVHCLFVVDTFLDAWTDYNTFLPWQI